MENNQLSKKQELHYKIRTCLARMYAETCLDSFCNLQDSKLFSENIICTLLNILYGLNLHNGNIDKFNVQGFDLIDKDNKILVQVSSQNSKHKVLCSLIKCDKEDYKDYTFYYFHIFPRRLYIHPNYLPQYIKYDKSNYYKNLGTITQDIYNINDNGTIKELSDYLESQFGPIKIYKDIEKRKNTNTLRLIKFYLSENETINAFDAETYIKEEIDKLWDLLKQLPEKYREFFTIFIQNANYQNRTFSINYYLVCELFVEKNTILDNEIPRIIYFFDEYGICTYHAGNDDIYLNSIWEPIISLILSFTKFYDISLDLLVVNLQFDLFDEE